MNDCLGSAFPGIASRIPKIAIAALPTPVTRHDVTINGAARTVFVKHDEHTSELYGGNKIRKLEYILRRAIDRNAQRIATFGAAGSNHALATAMHAKALKLECTCFLAHQKPTPNVPTTLRKHLEIGTELVRYGGATNHLELFRRYIQGRHTWVVPLGGSCWYGALGFVNAGLELAQQIEAGDIVQPERIYIANGTMGSTGGLALGLALAGLPIEIHAVRVAANAYSRPEILQRLIEKTGMLMHRADSSVPDDLAANTRVVWRDGFFAGGYAVADEPTRNAVQFAGDTLDLVIDSTYTGKAMAALIQDAATHEGPMLFWNTYSSKPVNVAESVTTEALPPDFNRYFDY